MKYSRFSPRRIFRVVLRKIKHTSSNMRVRFMNRQVGQVPLRSGQPPVIFFNASTRISKVSLNAAYSRITSWMVRFSGTPIIHFVCQAGMSRCVLGTSRGNPHQALPCRQCMRRSSNLTAGCRVEPFTYALDTQLTNALAELGVNELSRFEKCVPSEWGLSVDTIPLGQLVLPAIRWYLRRHNLKDDDATRFLFREFILSAWNVAGRFNILLQQVHPRLVVVFNGQFFPEATARWVAQQAGIRVITHEVGLYPMTCFFTDHEATIYPIKIPEDYDLGPAQNERLDAYLEQRFKGKFTMAGVQFWPQMQGLDASFLERMAHYKQVVPVFTNVIFDTSQPHSNTLFRDMFDWLDHVLDVARKYPETFFLLRAHPDESRPGKAAQESVSQWVQEHDITSLPNVLFVGPDEYLSSYELIQRSKFVMIYNSTIGLEASIMGAAVLAAGFSRFTVYPTVFYPSSAEAYLQMLNEFLAVGKVEVPPEHHRQARRFLYYQVFRVSLPFDAYIESAETPGFVNFRPFQRSQLTPEHSPTAKAILDGLFEGKQFELEEF